METLFLNEQRCTCGKLLLKGIFFDGTLEIKCKKCGTINKIGSVKLADDDTHYLLIIDNKGIVTNISNSACNILGYKHEELIGKYFTEINPSLSKEIGKKFFGSESILSEDNYFQLDTIHQTKDGKNIPVLVLLKLYLPNSKERHVLVLVESKNIESNFKKIIDKENIKFIDNACDFYFDIDKFGIVEYISPSVKDFFVFTQEEIVGKNYFDKVPIGKRLESKKIFEYFSDNEKPYRTEDIACLSTNGKTMHSELFFTPNYNNIGKFIGYRILVWVKEKL